MVFTRPLLYCKVCKNATTGEMGTGEFYNNQRGESYWWCRLCKKCPHYNCNRLRCTSKNNELLSHCGLKCLTNRCNCIM